MQLIIRESSVSEIAREPNFPELGRQYAAELPVEGAPPFAAKMEMYRQIENTGKFTVFGAWIGNILVGLITLLVNDFPHTGVVMALAESFFVMRAFRGSGAGLKLLTLAEERSVRKGSNWLLVSAPSGGDLCIVLPRRGYTETNRVFFKDLRHA